MPVCEGPPYPALAYYSIDRPAAYGFMAHHINKLKEREFSDLRAARQAEKNDRYSSKSGYASSLRTECSDTTRSSSGSSSSAVGITFPVPQAHVSSTESLPISLAPQQVTFSPHACPPVPVRLPRPTVERRVHFPSPHLYNPNSSVPPVSMPVPLTAPPGPSHDTANKTPRHVYRAPPQFGPSPSDGTPSPQQSRIPAYGTFTTSSNRSPSNRSFSSSSSSAGSRPQRINYDALQKASDNIEIVRQISAEWMNVIHQNRTEKLNDEEREVISILKDLRQKAHGARQMTFAILHTLRADHGSLRGTQVTSGKMAAHLSRLSALGTYLRVKLSILVRMLKRARVKGHAKKPSRFSAVMDAPGCLAGLCLKRRLFRFTSLARAGRDQYSDLDSQASVSLRSDRLPMTWFLSLLYDEVQRTYGTMSKALADFEVFLHYFQLEFQMKTTGRNYSLAEINY